MLAQERKTEDLPQVGTLGTEHPISSRATPAKALTKGLGQWIFFCRRLDFRSFYTTNGGGAMRSPTHEEDFLLWTEEQASLLRAGRIAELDVENILDEIEDMGREQKMALQSLMRMILVHLLKLDLSMARDPRAKWIEEVLEFRAQAESRLDDTPSLRHYADELFRKAWPQARRIAQKSLEAHGEVAELPAECPYTLEQVLDADFLPQ
jgi:predicted DNA-binding ribbon-helix-helix protein